MLLSFAQFERELTAERIRDKMVGGVPFSRGQLYKMLQCRLYLGEIPHKDQVYPGLHPPIIDRDIWDHVQAMLTTNTQGTRPLPRLHSGDHPPVGRRLRLRGDAPTLGSRAHVRLDDALA